MYRILICEDEADIRNALKIYLKDEQNEFFEAENGAEALECLKRNDIHLILMDIMMPKMDGITALAKIREMSNVPVILLTAKSEDTDKVLGLHVGADDYITKPFNSVEVLARVKSQLRRYLQLGGRVAVSNVYEVGGICVDDNAKTVTRDGEIISLTPKEYDILKLLIQFPNKVFSPKQIYETVWEDVSLGNETSIAVHIRHLREKLEALPSEPQYLKVVWGQGYKIQG